MGGEGSGILSPPPHTSTLHTWAARAVAALLAALASAFDAALTAALAAATALAAAFLVLTAATT